METWLLILILVLTVQFIASLHTFIKGECCITPMDIHDSNDITWFGAIVLFIIWFMLVPFLYLFTLLKWLFTGRWRDDA